MGILTRRAQSAQRRGARNNQKEKSDGSAHQHAGAEDGLGEWGHDLEAGSYEHGGGAVSGFVAEGAGLPGGDGIGFDNTAAFFLDAGDSGF